MKYWKEIGTERRKEKDESSERIFSSL